MSTRSNLATYPVIVNGDMSAATITSAVTVLNTLTIGAYQYSWSGTAPIGTIAVQVSNDYALNAAGAVLNAGTWTTIYFQLNGSSIVNAAPVSGNTGTGIIEWSTGAQAIRTVYTKTSGTGTLQATIKAKVA